jgi:hypothetical protein
MPPTLDERRPAITPQLAVRVAVLGGFAFVLFAIIFFRLWFLQVLSGDDYVTQARENRVRKIKIEAPRGDIVDRDGNRLVITRVAPVVQIVPSGLPGWIIPLMFILEFATFVIIRPATLALRLMGNMLAGHLLLLVFTLGGEYLLLHSTAINKVPGVLSFGMTLVMSAFEILVEFLQAYVFVLLTAVYIAGAVADEH